MLGGRHLELFDSHAHLYDSRYEGEKEIIIDNARQNEVKYITNIGCDEATSRMAIAQAMAHENIFATIGLYPEYCNEERVDLSFLKELATKEKVVAIGEIGLDYHQETANSNNQIKHFIEQIEIANEYQLPVAIHSRNADMDMLSTLKNHKIERGFVMHCFSSSVEVAKEVLKLGGFISFSGTVTFKNARNLKEVMELVPLEKVLVETDSPYLSPEPKRGLRNEPANVRLVAQKLADIKEISLEKLATITTENAKRFYQIEKVS